jgi:hypothetical protein
MAQPDHDGGRADTRTSVAVLSVSARSGILVRRRQPTGPHIYTDIHRRGHHGR